MKMLPYILSVLLAAPASVTAETEKIYVYKTVLILPKAPIIIDGELSDWEGINVKAQAMDNHIVLGKWIYEPSGKADLSGTFKCVVDPDNIYLAVTINDDKLVFGEHEFGDYWEDDSVEIYLDGDLVPPSEKKAPVRVPGYEGDYDANDAQIRISKDSTGKVVMDGMGVFRQRMLQLPGLWESLGIIAALKENPDGYTMEVKIPKLTFVSRPFRVGSEFGLDVQAYDDDDGGGADHNISWTEDPESKRWRSTEGIGRVRIERESNP